MDVKQDVKTETTGARLERLLPRGYRGEIATLLCCTTLFSEASEQSDSELLKQTIARALILHETYQEGFIELLRALEAVERQQRLDLSKFFGDLFWKISGYDYCYRGGLKNVKNQQVILWLIAAVARQFSVNVTEASKEAFTFLGRAYNEIMSRELGSSLAPHDEYVWWLRDKMEPILRDRFNGMMHGLVGSEPNPLDLLEYWFSRPNIDVMIRRMLKVVWLRFDKEDSFSRMLAAKPWLDMAPTTLPVEVLAYEKELQSYPDTKVYTHVEWLYNGTTGTVNIHLYIIKPTNTAEDYWSKFKDWAIQMRAKYHLPEGWECRPVFQGTIG